MYSENNAQLRSFYKQLPFGVTVEDYSAVKPEVDKLLAEGVKDLGQYLRNNPDILFNLMRKVQAIDANEAMLKLFKVESFQQYNDYFLDFEHWGATNEWVDYYMQEITCLVTGKPHSGDYHDLTADGTIIRYRSTSWVPSDFSDDWSVLITTHKDITERKKLELERQRSHEELERKVDERTQALTFEVIERKQAEDKAIQSKERFRDFAETASDWFWEQDTNFRFTHLSSLDEHDFGNRSKEAIGKTRWELMGVDPEDSEYWKCHVDDLLAQRTFRDFRQVVPDLFGREHIFNICGKPIFDAEGIFIGYRGTISDVTKEQEEQEKLSKLSHALEQSPSMVFITDAMGNIEYTNKKFTEISGYAADEVLGENTRILQSGDTPRKVYTEMWNTITSGQEWRGELKDRCKDGSVFWADASILSVKDSEDRIINYVCMHEDITKRKNVEIRERQAREKAELATRIKSELMANMSHELRTPLNAIIGFSETMKEEVFGSVGSDKNLEYLDDIHFSGQHLLGLINDILDVSAIEAGALELDEEDVCLSDLTDATIRLIQSRAKSGKVTIASSIDPKLPQIYADERRVKQIMLNLLSNAVKFTQEGGKVSVDAWTNDNGSLAIAVSDTGIGMDGKEVSTALGRFGQVDSGLNRKHEGTGLGLPLTNGLIELHGGVMAINSKKGHGTEIIVTFPKERVAQNVR